MRHSRLAELAWASMDNRSSEGEPHAVILDADEVAWLLERWPRGRRILAAEQIRYESSNAESP